MKNRDCDAKLIHCPKHVLTMSHDAFSSSANIVKGAAGKLWTSQLIENHTSLVEFHTFGLITSEKW